MEILTSAQMRALEATAMADGRVSGHDLMERAGQGVVAALIAHWPRFARPHCARVVCGPGNNGGDGFVVARLLHDRGWRVEVMQVGDARKAGPDASLNRELWCQRGAVLMGGDGMQDADLLVDAIFGIGLTRPMEQDMNPGPLAHGAVTVAIDVPSGLDADRGLWMAPRLDADLTVTFHRAKTGHYLGEGPAACGDLQVVDIGLAEVPVDAVRLVGAPAAARLSKAGGAGHKFAHGHAVVVSGGVGRGGAARLAARAALRIGAGLVTIACPGTALAENAARLDAIMLRSVDEPEALGSLLDDSRITALAVGPGLGLGPDAAALVNAALRARAARPVDRPLALVLDADALTLIAQDARLAQCLDPSCILTPHAGEFARLCPDLAERSASAGGLSKVEAARQAAIRLNVTLLLKGPDTVIAAPTGEVAIHSAAYGRAAPWLATAGAGDVLSGLIAGLRARGLPTMEAAGAAAWLHVEGARAFGPGLIAEDLPEAIPAVLRKLTGHLGI